MAHTKIDEIVDVAKQNDFDCICLSETWLDNSIHSDDLNIPDYTLYRRDRNRHGGGVATYVSDCIPTTRRLDLEHPDVECLWLECTVQSKRVLVATYYRPPGQRVNAIDNFIEKLEESLNLALACNPDLLLIMGDFNDRCRAWNSDHADSELKLKLFDLVQQNGLFQLIDEPTRCTAATSSLLDLVITDAPAYIEKSGILPPIAELDHCIVHCSLTLHQTKQSPYTREIWNYRATNFQDLNLALSQIPWNTENNADIDGQVERWSNLFLETCKLYVPVKKVIIRPHDKPWMSPHIHKLIRLRNRAWKRFHRTSNPVHEEIFKRIRRYTKLYINHAKNQYNCWVNDRLDDPHCPPKDYWKLIKSTLGSKGPSNIPPLASNGRVISDAEEKSDVFNEFFAEQSSLPPPPPGFTLPELVVPPFSLDSILTTEDEVLNVLKSLKVDKANGPDNISNRLLKETAHSIAKPLSELFNSSLASGTFPHQWKQANVVPVYKKNDKQNVTNYRPIALLACVSKVFERIVYNKLYAYCEQYNLLTWRNAGFKPMDSTVNQLIVLVHNIQEALDKGKDVCMVFLDISKAFDKVYHEGLLHKLQTFGITGSLLRWFHSYLSDRKQRVVLPGASSTWRATNAGVPQGSILGPILFLIYINDIVNNLESNPFLFADDTSLFEILDQPHEAISKINRDLHRINLWSEQWRVTFSAPKTHYMIFSKKIIKPIYQPLYFGGQQIQQIPQHKHIGLNFNEKLTWDDHIKAICSKAMQRVGILKRTSRLIPRKAKETVYSAFIRPLLEYASVIFDGCTKKLANSLERVQRQAALACTGAYQRTSHNSLLQELGWDTLATRRECHKLTYMYKIVNGLVPHYLQTLCTQRVHERTTYNLRNRNNLIVPYTRTVSFSRSFIPSSIRLWNNLQIDIRESQTLSSFKSTLRSLKSRNRNPLFSIYNGYGPLNHSRMRMGLCGLNFHRHRYRFIDNSHCPNCLAPREDSSHFLLSCPRYAAQRDLLLRSVAPVVSPGVHFSSLIENTGTAQLTDIFLFGSPTLPFQTNSEIFAAVDLYISQSRRF